MFGPADTRVMPWKRWECRPDLCTRYHFWDGSRWWEGGEPYHGLPLPCMRGRGPEAPRPNTEPHRQRPASVDTIERARRYVERMPPAISGSGGHAATFEVACVLVRGFRLAPREALTILKEYNARCQPPWLESDLIHKIRSALRHGKMAFGKLLEARR